MNIVPTLIVSTITTDNGSGSGSRNNCVTRDVNAATAIISSNSGDYQRGHDVRDVPRNVLLQAGETDFSSVLRVDSDLKLSNISHHSPVKPSSTSSHSTFIFESETDTDTDTDTDAETENDIDAYIDTSIPNLLL